MHTIHKASIAAALALFSAPSFAEVLVENRSPNETVYREAVNAADLNLETTQGIERLNHRLYSAVSRVCTTPGIRDKEQATMDRSCREESFAQAITSRNELIQAQRAAQGNPERVAALNATIPVSRR